MKLPVPVKMLLSVPAVAAIHAFYLFTRAVVKADKALDKLGDRIIAWAERNA